MKTTILTPSFPSGGVFTVCAETTINTSNTRLIMDTLLDHKAYKKWNSFYRILSVQSPTPKNDKIDKRCFIAREPIFQNRRE